MQRRERREEGKSAKHLISSQAIRKACDVIYSFSGGIYSRFEKQLNFSLIISIPYNVYLNTAFYSSSWLLTQPFTVASGYCRHNCVRITNSSTESCSGRCVISGLLSTATVFSAGSGERIVLIELRIVLRR